ncbi:UPF0182 family membrane protein [Alkaliphilus metalliredigens]|uniref:UPF0182 family membrane protein n=1 Tax=Alkaliphilus metalliredigens TaxID=208226 RepID=UPI00059F00D0|nr:UPF0182 family protein [Alkaliphilus metalliredigens]
MKNRKKVIIGLGIFIFIFLFGFLSEILSFITDYQWFQELGYESVFLTKLKTQLQIGIPLFIVGTILYYLYLIGLKKEYYKQIKSYHMDISEKRVNQILILPAFVFGLMTSTSVAGSLWFDILLYANAKPFNLTDPLFNNDITYYLLELPFLKQLLNTVTSILFLMVIITVIFYVIMFLIRRPTLYEVKADLQWNSNFFVSLLQIALKQFAALGVIFFLVLAARYYLGVYDLLYSTRGVVYGASYTDTHVTLWVYRAQILASLLSATGVVYAYVKRNPKLLLIAPISIIAVGILGNVISLGVQNFIVSPNEIARELPYIEHNLSYTRRAYGIGEIQETDFPYDTELTREDIENNQEIIDNIRINDYRPALEVYNQIQAFRPYYRFVDVDIDRYWVNGEYRQVFIAPRELDQRELSDNAQTWINQTLKYTHGYGVALSPVNEVTSGGQPVLWMRNFPLVSSVDIEVTRPEIYFGELTDQYIIVNTKEKEFDYPLDNDNAETLYEGTAGVPLKGVNRLLYSWRQGTLKMLLSGNITSESRIVFDRNIVTRMNKIAPFITYDEDPYIVINEGKLYWMIDGYTISGNFPYAEPYMAGNNNYIRNSVKVVIDAYNGTVDYYISDEEDPIILTYQAIFPDLFKPLDDMPEGLKAHIRYPQVLFDIQSEVYATYHMNNPRVFYNKEDLWRIAREKYDQNEQTIESQYMMMKLPGEESEEFVISVPYTPIRLDNMRALLVARNDGEQYGELIAYRMPKDQNVYGPKQIEDRIDQNTTISQNLSLWGEGGSSVIRGNLLVVPIENSLLYVEPLYIRATSGTSLPEVKMVIVSFGDQIVMEPTLEEALNRIFGARVEEIREEIQEEVEGDTDGETITEEITEGLGEASQLIRRASEVFDRAQEASRQGNWSAYGDALEELEQVLRQLQETTQVLEN